MTNNLRKNIVAALMKNDKLTQKEIAAGAKVSTTTISNAMKNPDKKQYSMTIEKVKKYFTDNNLEWI